ncbi:AlpA family transcriptional regulator [Burkholderia pseudomallei]|uniref:AlpA family transcriptional regulator n=1 Tax=Burkholderia pseudomallei TaxID=28450 RepID=UPI0021F6B23B|nr:AlpA family transcriptional regulator [Burkholderia pseudomallei]MCW0111793.1 AlpA family transcriptional regulator [Burkholderia pseudomallei]
MPRTPASPDNPVEYRILRRADVERRTGFKRSHIYSLMQQGKFPKAIPIGARAVGWDSREIDQWIEERLRQRS